MPIAAHWFLPTNGDSRTDLSLGNLTPLGSATGTLVNVSTLETQGIAAATTGERASSRATWPIPLRARRCDPRFHSRWSLSPPTSRSTPLPTQPR